MCAEMAGGGGDVDMCGGGGDATTGDDDGEEKMCGDDMACEAGGDGRAASPVKKRSRVRYQGTATENAQRPKRGPNAFMIYSKEKRQAYDLKAMKVTEVAKAIGAEWRALPEEEKSRYKQMALQVKAAA